ncbi:solute carrier family 2, facilitated glucose transporter member 10 isoform X3 [Engystomops pustulosus]|uniref:solute carrier family 2, facilitated glucose transporter member 10 isoform X3 n=1 Tax=Engystomops pustulosus TaxID=76066 RepID=UPI003AFA3ECB
MTGAAGPAFVTSLALYRVCVLSSETTFRFLFSLTYGVPTVVLILSAVVSFLGGLLFGYELGIISGALLWLKSEFLLTCFQQEVLVSAVLVGALVASLVGGFLIDRSGRRTSILASNLLVLGGSIILISSGSFSWLVVGRVTIGFAISISSMACCIYVSEIVQPHQRGMLVSLYETGITVGILLSYGMNYFLSSWKYMFGLAISPALLQFFSIFFLPSKLSTRNPSDEESHSGLIELLDTDNVEDPKRVYSFCDLFGTKDNMRTRTLLGSGLVLFQQFTGQPNVLYYASTIFCSVGFQSNSSAMLAAVGLGIVKVLSTLLAMSCADKVGRRVLLFAGCILMTVSISTIGCASFVIQLDTHKSCELLAYANSSNSTIRLKSIDNITVLLQDQLSDPKISAQDFTSRMLNNYTADVTSPIMGQVKHTDALVRDDQLQSNTFLNWVTLVSLMVFVSAFSFGFGPMTWLVLSEIYPTEIRGRAFAFCNSINWATNLLITLTFLDVIRFIGLSATFLLYGIVGITAVIFIYIYIPETKGKTFQEIDELFSNKRFLAKSQIWQKMEMCRSSGHRYRKIEQFPTSNSSTSS